MKKLLLVLAIGAFVACNDGGGATDTPAGDSSTAAPAPVDSNTVAPVDTTHKDTTVTSVPDTTIKK
jgi:hypothetical protein